MIFSGKNHAFLVCLNPSRGSHRPGNSRTSPQFGRSGFALPIAITMFALVSAALAALTMLLYTEAKRTQLASQDAQLRQIVLAAGAFTEQMLDRNQLKPGEAADVPLPRAT